MCRFVFIRSCYLTRCFNVRVEMAQINKMINNETEMKQMKGIISFIAAHKYQYQ